MLTTDPGRASADWLEAFLDTLKIPAPIAPSVQSDVRSCVVRLKQAQLRLRPIPGSRAFASLSCEEVDYVSGTHVRDTHHIVLRGLELAVGVSAQTQNSGASGPQVHPSTIPWQALPVIASDSSLVITVCSRNKEATRPRVVHASQEAFVPPVWEVLVTNAHLRVATTPEDLVALKHLAGDVGKAPARCSHFQHVATACFLILADAQVALTHTTCCVILSVQAGIRRTCTRRGRGCHHRGHAA